MPEFHYTAMDAQGRTIQGNLTAADNHALAAELQRTGLFLVSARTLEDDPPVPESTDAPSVSEETPWPEKRDESTLSGALENITCAQRLILAAVLAAGILSGFWQVYHNRHPKSRYSAHGAGFSQIRPDMTRRQVEKIFPTRHPGSRLSDRTLYFVPPDTIVEIRYDEQGGPWSGDNRVQKDGMSVMRVSDIERSPH